jgi:hypothetical protein
MNAMEKLNPVCMRDRVDSLVDWLDVHTESMGRGLTRGQAEEALRWMRHEYERMLPLTQKLEEARDVWRAIHDEAEFTDTPNKGAVTLVTSEMKGLMSRALGLCENCLLLPGCPDCRAVHDVPEGA